jgi:hypothetical protein
MIVKPRPAKTGDARVSGDLTPGQAYSVIGIEADDFRLLNDAGRPFLYPADAFEVVDPTRPPEWVVEHGDEGECYAYPPPLNEPGFFEDFFDDEPAAVARFWRVVNANLTRAA